MIKLVLKSAVSGYFFQKNCPNKVRAVLVNKLIEYPCFSQAGGYSNIPTPNSAIDTAMD